MKNTKKIPTLRFPEFSGEWEVKKISDLGDIVTGTTPDTNVKDYYDGNRLFVSPTDIQKNRFVITTKTKLTDLGILQGRLVKKNSILFVCIGSTIGKVAQAGIDCITNQQINSIIPLTEKYNENFLFSLLEYKADKIKLLAGEQAVPIINKTNFSKIELVLPYIQEQQKIADFLTQIDNRIEKLTKKKQLLEKYKKGVMQKIFNQEIRFKNDNDDDYSDWEIKELGTITKIYDGTHMTPDYKENGIPFYSVENITNNNFVNTKFISKNVFEKENKRVKLEKEDILMTKIGDIGTAKYIDWDVEASFYVSLALIKKNKNNNTKFISQYIKSSFFKKELHKRIIHVAFPKKINLGEISNCLIKLPCLEEQQKIANFLTEIDKKINLTEKQLNGTKQYKKGLLQQMFI
jgi:type I restriction enzyme S subunit